MKAATNTAVVLAVMALLNNEIISLALLSVLSLAGLIFLLQKISEERE